MYKINKQTFRYKYFLKWFKLYDYNNIGDDDDISDKFQNSNIFKRYIRIS